MQNAIRLIIRKVINEAIESIHYTQRVFNRLVEADVVTVGYEVPGVENGEYKEVGNYALPNELKNRILQNTKLVENYIFPKSKSYAIKIADIIIDYSKVKFFSEEEKKFVYKERPSLLIIDSLTNSNGNQIFAIVRKNIIVTAFFGKNYSMKFPEKKMKVDVYVKNIDSLEKKEIY